jgi:hypothetical protein
MSELRVTTISELVEYQKGAMVELPPFADGMPFIARLRRPSLMALAIKGQIPNELLSSANELFSAPAGQPVNVDMQEAFKVLEILCYACFLEPTYKELKENGIELCDDQFTYIFNYSQAGVKALEPFRTQQAKPKRNANGKNVQQKTK